MIDVVRAQLPGSEVVRAVDEHAVSFDRMGGWDPWTAYVGGGRRWTGEVTFDAYVVVNPVIGKATAQILVAALRERRRVVYFDPQTEAPHVVRQIGAIPGNEEDWSRGWCVML